VAFSAAVVILEKEESMFHCSSGAMQMRDALVLSYGVSRFSLVLFFLMGLAPALQAQTALLTATLDVTDIAGIPDPPPPREITYGESLNLQAVFIEQNGLVDATEVDMYFFFDAALSNSVLPDVIVTGSSTTPTINWDSPRQLHVYNITVPAGGQVTIDINGVTIQEWGTPGQGCVFAEILYRAIPGNPATTFVQTDDPDVDIDPPDHTCVSIVPPGFSVLSGHLKFGDRPYLADMPAREAAITNRASALMAAYPETDFLTLGEYVLLPRETTDDTNDLSISLTLDWTGSHYEIVTGDSNSNVASAVAACRDIANTYSVYFLVGTVPVRVEPDPGDYPDLPSEIVFNTALIIDTNGLIIDIDHKHRYSFPGAGSLGNPEAEDQIDAITLETTSVRAILTRDNDAFTYFLIICAERTLSDPNRAPMAEMVAGSRADLLIEVAMDGGVEHEDLAQWYFDHPGDDTHSKEGMFDTGWRGPFVRDYGINRADGFFAANDANKPAGMAAGVYFDRRQQDILDIRPDWSVVGFKVVRDNDCPFTYTSDGTNVTITGYIGSGGDVAIPGSIKGRPVTTIGDRAFCYCSVLTSVTIPDSVSAINTGAFARCEGLLRMYFAGDAPAPGAQVFDHADSVTVYYLPGTTGWGATFVGRPAVLWNPEFSAVGLQPTPVSLTVTGTPGIPVALEATTNLLADGWLRLHTTNLTGGSIDFHDPDWSNYPGRCYHVVGP